MARHGPYRIGRLVHRFKAPGQTQAGLLLLHCQQCAVGGVGMAGTGLGVDHPAGVSVRHEPAGLEEKHRDGGGINTRPHYFELSVGHCRRRQRPTPVHRLC